MDDRKLRLMGRTPVKSAIIRLAGPTMLAATVQIIYNWTDTAFIGLLGNSDLVAAISLALPLVFLIVAIGNIFGIGAASYISRQLGAKNMTEARHANSVAFYTAAGAGAVISASIFALREPLLHIIGTSAETFGPTFEYFSILIAFGPLLVLQVALAGLVRSEGATAKAMWGMVIGFGTNIVLDPVFIFGFGMGIKGAAWATVIGNGLGVLFYILHFIKGKTLLSIKLRDFRPTRRIYWQTLEIGVPASLSMLVMSVSFILGNVFANVYGDEVVAGFGICQRVMSMCIMLMVGVSQGYQPFAGYNYGAKQFDRLKSGLKVTMLYNISLGIFFMVFFLFFSREITGLFIKGNPATVDAAQMFVRAFALGMPFVGLQMTLMVTFQATGKAVRAMLISLGRQAIVFLPLLFLLNYLFGLDGFVYAQPLADIISAVAAVLLSISFIRQLRAMHDEQRDRTELAEAERA
jgi:multidrug efflux pump